MWRKEEGDGGEGGRGGTGREGAGSDRGAPVRRRPGGEGAAVVSGRNLRAVTSAGAPPVRGGEGAARRREKRAA